MNEAPCGSEQRAAVEILPEGVIVASLTVLFLKIGLAVIGQIQKAQRFLVDTQRIRNEIFEKNSMTILPARQVKKLAGVAAQAPHVPVLQDARIATAFRDFLAGSACLL